MGFRNIFGSAVSQALEDILPFDDDFDRANGPVGNGWTAPGWTIDTGRASNDPLFGAAGRFMLRDFETSDVGVECDWNQMDTGMPCGVVVNLDDPANPLNYVVASMLEGEIDFYKVVNGVLTSMYFDTGAVGLLRLEKRGTEYKLYLSGSLISTVAIADAGIVSNVYHGALSSGGHTYAQLDSILVFALP